MKNIILLILIVAFFSCETKTTNDNDFTLESVKNAVIYEVNIRQYSKSGTFDEFTEDIPKIKELGVKILWLMPIHPISKKNRKGELGSYYSISDYKKVNPEFGNKEDLDNLIKTAHDNGMYVILDWVANHTGWDHSWIENNPEYYTKNTKGEITDPINPETGKSWGWTDVADLNFENKEMQNEMIEAMEYWVKEHDIDGYRADAAHSCPVSFWNEAITRLNNIKKVLMLAESDGYHNGGFELVELFDMSYSWPGHHILNRIANEENNVNDLIKNIKTNFQDYSKKHILMNFTTNHDENSWGGTVFERLGQGAKALSALTYFLPGMPLVYNGQEYGLDKRLNFFKKDFIEKKQNEFFDFYKTLGEIKTSNKALNIDEDFVFNILETNNPSIVLLKRKNKNQTLYFLANLSKEDQLINIDLEGSFTSLVDKSIYNIVQNKKLKAWEFHFLNKL